jgi:hypothetical protein
LKNTSKSRPVAGPWWIKPVILVTWEVEIGRITVSGHPRQKVSKILSHSVAGQHVLVIPATRKTKIRKVMISGQPPHTKEVS